MRNKRVEAPQSWPICVERAPPPRWEGRALEASAATLTTVWPTSRDAGSYIRFPMITLCGLQILTDGVSSAFLCFLHRGIILSLLRFYNP